MDEDKDNEIDQKFGSALPVRRLIRDGNGLTGDIQDKANVFGYC